MAPANDYQGFEDFLWSGLSPRKYFAGRRRVATLIAEAVALWPERNIAEFEVEPFRKFLTDSLSYRIRSEYGDKRFGSILVIILTAVAIELIKLMIQWWLSRDSHREMMRVWRRRHG